MKPGKDKDHDEIEGTGSMHTIYGFGAGCKNGKEIRAYEMD